MSLFYTSHPDHNTQMYKDQATLEYVNKGNPYFVSSPDYGYEGEFIPIAGSVSTMEYINETTGKPISYRDSGNLWVTCIKSIHSYNKPYHRCSLLDDGVIYSTYSTRLAFTNPFAAKYYAETGKLME